MFEVMQQRVNNNSRLLHQGRFVTTQFLVASDDQEWLVTIERGMINSVTKGPFVMSRWVFALRGTSEAWQAFSQPLPKPGFHDLMALVKFRRLKVEGDQHPFMANLLYFKEVMATIRPVDTAEELSP